MPIPIKRGLQNPTPEPKINYNSYVAHIRSLYIVMSNGLFPTCHINNLDWSLTFITSSIISSKCNSIRKCIYNHSSRTV